MILKKCTAKRLSSNLTQTNMLISSISFSVSTDHVAVKWPSSTATINCRKMLSEKKSLKVSCSQTRRTAIPMNSRCVSWEYLLRQVLANQFSFWITWAMQPHVIPVSMRLKRSRSSSSSNRMSSVYGLRHSLWSMPFLSQPSYQPRILPSTLFGS